MKVILFVLALPFLLLSGGLLLNRPPLLSPPGPFERVRTYLTTNVAESQADHVFPELRPLRLRADRNQVRDAVVAAMEALGWTDIEARDSEVRAVVVTTLFRFRDDVTAWTEQAGADTLVQVRSASRIGKGDLAANARHILDLFERTRAGLEGSGRK